MVDDELNTVPSITLDQDDIVIRQGRRPPAPESQLRQSGSKSPLVLPAVLGCVILLFSGAVWWLHRQAMTTQKQLEEAATKIQQLEARLASTDTTITKSEVLLADKLKSMDMQIDTHKNEIRKLWGLAGDTQRKAIEQARMTNDQQAASIRELQQQLATLEQKNSDLQASLEQNTAATKNSEASTREAVQRVELVQEKMATADADLKSLKQKQGALEGEYSKRVAALEDTAKSTDVFRRNTQDELRKLKDELMKLSAPSAKSNP